MKRQFYSTFLLVSFFLSTALFFNNGYAQVCNPLVTSYGVLESRCASTGELYISASGGSGNFLYKISGPVSTNFSTSDTITGLSAGKYLVIIKDIITNCVYQNDSVTIPGDYQDPAFLMHKTDVTCINGSDGTIEVYNQQYGRAPFVYSIEAPSASNVGVQNTTGLFTGLLYGDYTIRLTDSCGGIQTRSMTIDNYDWWIDSFDVTRICDSAWAIIKLKDSRGTTSPDSVFAGFTYAVITAPGDTTWSSSIPFTFLLGNKRSVTLLAKDKCGNVKTVVWNETRVPSVNANVSINPACSTFTVAVTGVVNFTNPQFCLYNTKNFLIACDSSGSFKNLAYGSYCIRITDACYDTTITRCFTVTKPLPSVGANVVISNTTCTEFTVSVTAFTNLNNPQFCIYGKDSVVITCNTTGIFTNLPYGTYCIQITNDPACYDTVITRCFTVGPPLPSFSGVNIIRACSTITIIAGDTSNLNNPQFCLYDANGVLIICNSTGIFDNLPYGYYCVEAINNPGCYDTTIRVCINVVRPVPSVSATVKISAKTCSSFTAEIQGQQNLNNAQYCLYNSSNVLVSCNSTGKFTSLLYGTYCIRVTNNPGCYDTVITRCFTVVQPLLNFTLSAAKSCSTYGTTDVTVHIASGTAPYGITILDDAGVVMLTTVTSSTSYKAVGLRNLPVPEQYAVIVTDQCGYTDTLLVTPNASELTKKITVVKKCPSGINPAGGADLDITATTNMGSVTPKIIKKNNSAFVVNYNYNSGSLFRFSQLPPATYIVEYATSGCTLKLYDTVVVIPYTYPDLSQSRAYRCDGNSISIGAVVTGGMSPFMYEIFQSIPATPSIVSPPQPNPIFTFSNTTNYTLIRLRALDGCGNASINDVSMQPLAPILISPSTPLTCYYDSLTLSVDTIANATYAWYHKTSPTDSVQVSSTYWYYINAIQPADTGWYVCHVSINNYCLNRTAYYHLQNVCGVTLPVQLVLAAAKKEQGHLLSWNTFNESDIKQYSIERSANGRNGFAAIGARAYAGSGTANSYLFTDAMPLAGDNYYRLKITGLTGKIMYSNTVVVKHRSDQVRVYPNPVREQLYIDVSNMPAGKYSIDIFSVSGARVQTVSAPQLQNGIIIIPRSAAVKPGLYLIAITNSTAGWQQFVKAVYQ